MWVLTSIAIAAEPAVLFPAWPGDGEDRTAIALVVPEAEMKALVGKRGPEGTDVNSDGGAYTRWSLQADAAGGVAVGSTWAMLSEGARTECTVESLHMVTAGGPDRETWDFDDVGAPCGTPLVYARTSCVGVPVEVVVPASNDRAAVAEVLSTPETPMFDGLTGIDAVRDTVTSAAAGRRVRGEVNQTVYRLGTQEVTVTHGHFYTGQAEWACGGEDQSTWWGGVQGAGHTGAVRSLDHGSISTVLDLDGDGRAEIVERDGGSWVLMDADGKLLLRHDSEWCVCGC